MTENRRPLRQAIQRGQELLERWVDDVARLLAGRRRKAPALAPVRPNVAPRSPR